MEDSRLQARHARWEKLGIERVKADLLAGGHEIVGGTPEVRAAAWAWVKGKETSTKEILTLKPGYLGMSLDLKAAWRALKAKWQHRHG